MEDFKISLHQIKTRSREILTSVSFMIKVPNFFTLPENDDNEVKMNSTSFEFANATWQFQFISEKKLRRTGRLLKMFKVSLKKISLLESRNITFSILLLDADKEKHDHQFGKCVFDNSFLNDFDMATFGNDNLFFDRRETLTLIIDLICDKVPKTQVVPLIIDLICDKVPKTQVVPLAGKEIIKTMVDCRISLSELPKRTLSSVICRMTVPNFFNLPYINRAINSQRFEFCNATWLFLFMANEKSDGTFSLYLERLNSEVRNHLISYTISLWDEDNKICNGNVGFYLFEENKNDTCVLTLSKDLLKRRQETLTLVAHLIWVKSLEGHVVQEPLKKQLQKDFEGLFLNGKNYDLILRVAEKEFRVHKDVLMSRSPVFESMLSCDMLEKNKSFIDIPDCDPKVMELFLLYIYCGKLDELDIDDAVNLYYIADKYSIALLKKECSKFIKRSLSPQIICDVIRLSINHSDSDLLEYATEYFHNHMHDIFTTPKWMSFLTENVTAANELLVLASKKWKSI